MFFKPLWTKLCEHKKNGKTTTTKIISTSVDKVLATFKIDYDFLAFELIVLNTRPSAILILKRKTALRFDMKLSLRTPVNSLDVSKSHTRSQI